MSGDGGFDEATATIDAATRPAELFGTDPAGAVHRYRRLAKAVHPDRVDPARRTAATATFARLTALWRAYRQVVTLTTRRGAYRVGPVVHTGDLADLHRVDGPDTVLLKVARQAGDGDLIDREARALATIAAGGDPRFLPYVPRLVDSLRLRDPGTGVERAGNVLATAGGLVSLAEVLRAYPEGLDPRDVAWMWRRLLVALGLAHRAGVVHGAVLPDHVLIEPVEHGVLLVDWCYAAIGPDDRVPALVARYADWYPAEVTDRGAPGPGTDIAMATRCMSALMGGAAPRPLAAFAAGCLLDPLPRRPDDAWRLLGELDDVLERLYGPRRFRQFAFSRLAA